MSARGHHRPGRPRALRGAWLRRPLVMFLALAAVVAVVAVRDEPADPTQTIADLSQFNPANIISDEVFFFGGAMSAAEVQGFLDAKNPSCTPGSDGSPCLRSFRQDTTSRAQDGNCDGYGGAPGESAATIITKVARSCSISPKVLLVMLQKEQGLVTGSGTGLYAKRYQKAMGYACPDTAPCDTAYYGFQNQVYMAAWQMQQYAHNPTKYAYRSGRTVNIQFNPDASCGSSPVTIQNQATAGLYVYTPYQPNAAALRGGGGDGCSAFGNRNFWVYFTDWFISTQSDAAARATPKGVLDSLTMTASGFSASGWVFDPDAPNAPVTVRALVDGAVAQTVQADGARPDVATAYGVGTQHGFAIGGLLSHGSHQICVVADNLAGAGVQRQLDCKTVTFTNQVPVVNFDGFAEQADGSVRINGWAFDPDGDAVQLHVYDNNAGRAYTTTGARPDVQAAYPAAGATAGFDITVGPLSGTHGICVFAVDTVAAGNNQLVLCREFSYKYPFGVMDRVQETATGDLWVRGWGIDPSVPTASIPVHVYVDDRGAAFTGDLSRPDVGRAYPGTGTTHGFEGVVKAGAGAHVVCAFFINVGIGGANGSDCRSVTLTYQPPTGVVDRLSALGGGQVQVRGWAFDRSVPTDPLAIHYYVDGRGVAQGTANASRPDVETAYPGVGPTHGFDQTLAMTPGQHSVCTFAINTGVAGNNTLLDCAVVDVS
jgi:hypothetical protein